MTQTHTFGRCSFKPFKNDNYISEIPLSPWITNRGNLDSGLCFPERDGVTGLMQSFRPDVVSHFQCRCFKVTDPTGRGVPYSFATAAVGKSLLQSWVEHLAWGWGWRTPHRPTAGHQCRPWTWIRRSWHKRVLLTERRPEQLWSNRNTDVTNFHPRYYESLMKRHKNPKGFRPFLRLGGQYQTKVQHQQTILEQKGHNTKKHHWKGFPALSPRVPLF